MRVYSEQNSHRSQILATANVWVARAHVNKPNGSIEHEELQEQIGLEVLCRYYYVAKQRLIKKLEDLPPTQVN